MSSRQIEVSLFYEIGRWPLNLNSDRSQIRRIKPSPYIFASHPRRGTEFREKPGDSLFGQTEPQKDGLRIGAMDMEIPIRCLDLAGYGILSMRHGISLS
jgi:hypothetical protein